MQGEQEKQQNDKKIELTKDEAQQVLNYLGTRPLSEVYNLFNMVAEKFQYVKQNGNKK